MDYSKELLEFIEKNKELINKNHFDTLYNKLEKLNLALKSRVSFTYLIITAGIDILNYMTEIPEFFMNCLCLPDFESNPYFISKMREMILNLNKYPNIKSIKGCAFSYFPINSKLSLSNLEEIDSMAFSDTGITELEINNVGIIWYSAFKRNELLEKLIIDNVKSIHATFMLDNNKLGVVILKNIDVIRSNAFSLTTKEECNIYIADTVHEIQKDAFQEAGSNITIYCEAKERPKKWDKKWYGDIKTKNIIWGYKGGI